MQMLNVFDLIVEQRNLRPENVAIIDGSCQLTYKQLYDQVVSLARQLSSLEVKEGDRVAVNLNKSVDEVLVLLTLARLKAVSVIINYRWKAHQCNYILRDSAVKMIITDARRIPELNEFTGLPKNFSSLTVREGIVEKQDFENKSPMEHTAAFEDFSIPDNLAVILYTSGSTGMPKGVMLTHETVIKGAETVAGYLNNDATDRILSVLPLNFDYGLNQLTTMFLVGGTVVLQKTAMLSAIVDSLQLYKITGMAGVPTLWIDIVGYLEEAKIELTHLRYITNSGGKIPDGILSRMPEIFDEVEIYLMYGFTEAFRSTFLPPTRFKEKLGSMGKAVPGVDIHVVHPERGVCAPHVTGELIHCGSLMSSGYWNNKKATEQKIKPCEHLHHLIGDRPVVYSGDLVKYDEEGFLWFVARKDEMIKSSGNRISPTEVEEIAYKSGLVRHAVAFGVENDRLGQVVYLVITPLKLDFQKEELQFYCREHMPLYMVPEKIISWNEPMPLTGNGKIDRILLLKRIRIKHNLTISG